MLLAYPATLTLDRDRSTIVSFRDVPEALTNGRSSAEALARAEDALVVALSIYVEDERDIPVPSSTRRGQHRVRVPPLAAAKLAIHQGLRERKMRHATLARALRVDEKQIRRLLDLDHRSTLAQLDAALRALGKSMTIEIKDAA